MEPVGKEKKSVPTDKKSPPVPTDKKSLHVSHWTMGRLCTSFPSRSKSFQVAPFNQMSQVTRRSL